MKKLLFGTAGAPHSSKARSTVSGIERVKEIGLGCMEVEFVRGVKMGPETARKVALTSLELDIPLSVHAPYYINLNSPDEKKKLESVERIRRSAEIGGIFRARSIVFHPAFYMKSTKEVVYRRVKESLKCLLKELSEKGLKVLLRPETTGKRSQFGTLKELLRLSLELEGVMPCLDFSHLHARTGRTNTFEEFGEALSMVENALGKEGLENMHIHVSGIAYTRKGEKEHKNLADSDLDYRSLLRVWKDFDVKGLIICESPNLEEDALMLQKGYNELS